MKPDISDIKHYIIVSVLLFFSCAPSIKQQFYPGKYYTEDSIYENKIVGFAVTYTAGWYLFTDPSEMDQGTLHFSESLHKSRMELLYAGATADGLYGTRCIAANFNLSVDTFAQNIWNANQKEVENSQPLINFLMGNIHAEKWVYDQGDFRFSEYFFKSGTYDVRIAFWTKKALFDNYLSAFEGIISTFTIINQQL